MYKDEYVCVLLLILITLIFILCITIHVCVYIYKWMYVYDNPYFKQYLQSTLELAAG